MFNLKARSSLLRLSLLSQRLKPTRFLSRKSMLDLVPKHLQTKPKANSKASSALNSWQRLRPIFNHGSYLGKRVRMSIIQRICRRSFQRGGCTSNQLNLNREATSHLSSRLKKQLNRPSNQSEEKVVTR